MNQIISKSSDPTRLALILLGGQGVFIGVAMAFLYVTANTLFLVDFGSEALPYVYLAVGVFVSLTFYGYAELQRRWPPVWVILGTNVVIAAIYFLARFTLALSNNTAWISFALMTFFFFGVQMVFVSMGGQVGRLFDVRQVKQNFPLIIAAVNVAFILSSLSVSMLLPVLGRVENLLFLSGGAMLLVLLLSYITVQRFQPQFAPVAPQKRHSDRQAKSFLHLVRRKYVASIFSYQFLSSVGTQLALFLLITLADARYSQPADLARFFGNFAAGRNLLNVVFMIFLAGLLMRRFGLRFGLTANPIGVGVMITAMIAASVMLGQDTSLFWLAVVTVGLDVILSESITSTSLKAVYQALPASDRPVVETGVEGMGVPLAFGLTGALLLLANAISGLTFTHIILFTLLVTIFWIAAGFLVYRDYAATLLKTLSRRNLGEVALSLDDESSLLAVESLLHSNKLREVRLGLDMLAEAGHESLAAHLLRLLDHGDARIRTETLHRLERLAVPEALPAVEARLRLETEPPARGAAVQALCALKESDVVEEVRPYLADPAPEVRLGAMVGLLRYGGIPGILAAGERLLALENSSDPANRSFLAQVIGQVGVKNLYQQLVPLFDDDDMTVRRATLVAARQVNHPRLFPLIIRNLSDRRLRSLAAAALAAGGEAIVPITAQALAGETAYDEADVIRLVRVCGQIKGRPATAMLQQHLNHPDNDVQFQVLLALNLCGYRAGADDLAEIEQTLRGEIAHGLRTLLAKEDIGQAEPLNFLHRALDYEFEQALERVYLLLSFVYEPRAILRAEDQIRHGDKNQRALALETLDVTLHGGQKELVLALVDSSKPLSHRLQQLNRQFALPLLGREARLREIIADPEGEWTHGWSRACAIYAAAHLSLTGLVEVIEAALTITEHPIRETAAWALHRLAPDRYQAHAAALAQDASPSVAKLAAHLAGQGSPRPKILNMGNNYSV